MMRGLKNTTVTDESRPIISEPLTGAAQPDYLNSVVRIETSLSPDALLDSLHHIEADLGRVRTERYARRTIDLDILLYDDLIMDTEKLTIPHPQMHLRNFVMFGMMDIAPGLTHPLIGECMLELWRRLNGRSFMIAGDLPKLISIAGIIGVGKTTLAEAVADSIDCPIIREAYDTNPYISDVYAGRTDLALKSQLYFLNSRADQLSPQNFLPCQPIVSDYIFEKDRIFARRTLNGGQFSQYENRYDTVSAKVQSPSLVIYLKDEPDNALRKIRLRNRSYEQCIKTSTLADFSNDYDSLFEQYVTCPVITLNAAKFDCKNNDHLTNLVKQIRAYI